MLTYYDEFGEEIDSAAVGIFGLKLTVSSPSWEVETVVIEGKSGQEVIDSTLGPRKLNARVYTMSDDYMDSLELRNDVFAYFTNGRPFYIGEKNLPGVRWKVRSEEWTPERFDQKVQVFEIPLIAYSGSAESVQKFKRQFTTNSILFNNEGNLPIDMEEQNETEIEFRGVSTNLVIFNKTTGTKWQYNKPTTANDVVMIKGVKSTKNGVSIFEDTNLEVLKFKPGWNELEITGSTNFELSISTRFYFL